MNKISVIGAGAWGTALAQMLAKHGRDVTIWAREIPVVEDINEHNENKQFLPGISLHPAIKATNSLSQAAMADALLLVTPAQYLRSTLDAMKPDLQDGKPLIVCSKGIEITTGMLLSEVVEDVVPNTDCAILTGPTFAAEVAKGLPTAVTLAISDKDVGAELIEAIGCPEFRPYITADLVGAQLGGAAKNVLAIACGIVAGMKLGENARAALLTRGIAEISRLGTAMGSRKSTLMGMCGAGDLVLTCTSKKSRNYSLGFRLGEGESLDDILATRNAVTEGIHTAEALMKLAQKHAVEMPICMAVHEFLQGNTPLNEIMRHLMERPFGKEL